MYSIHKTALFIIIFISAFKGNSQEKIELPVSLYVSVTPFLFSENNKNINIDLDLIGYQFVILDIENIKSGLFTFSFENIGRTPTSFIYDSYAGIIFNETTKYYDPYKLAMLPVD